MDIYYNDSFTTELRTDIESADTPILLEAEHSVVTEGKVAIGHLKQCVAVVLTDGETYIPVHLNPSVDPEKALERLIGCYFEGKAVTAFVLPGTDVPQEVKPYQVMDKSAVTMIGVNRFFEKNINIKRIDTNERVGTVLLDVDAARIQASSSSLWSYPLGYSEHVPDYSDRMKNMHQSKRVLTDRLGEKCPTTFNVQVTADMAQLASHYFPGQSGPETRCL